MRPPERKSETIRTVTPNGLTRAADGFTSDLFDKQTDRYIIGQPPVATGQTR